MFKFIISEYEITHLDEVYIKENTSNSYRASRADSACNHRQTPSIKRTANNPSAIFPLHIYNKKHPCLVDAELLETCIKQPLQKEWVFFVHVLIYRSLSLLTELSQSCYRNAIFYYSVLSLQNFFQYSFDFVNLFTTDTSCQLIKQTLTRISRVFA